MVVATALACPGAVRTTTIDIAHSTETTLSRKSPLRANEPLPPSSLGRRSRRRSSRRRGRSGRARAWPGSRGCRRPRGLRAGRPGSKRGRFEGPRESVGVVGRDSCGEYTHMQMNVKPEGGEQESRRSGDQETAARAASISCSTAPLISCSEMCLSLRYRPSRNSWTGTSRPCVRSLRRDRRIFAIGTVTRYALALRHPSPAHSRPRLGASAVPSLPTPAERLERDEDFHPDRRRPRCRAHRCRVG